MTGGQQFLYNLMSQNIVHFLIRAKHSSVSLIGAESKGIHLIVQFNKSICVDELRLCLSRGRICC